MLGAAGLAGAGSGAAATGSGEVNGSLAVGSVTANTYRIHGNEYGGPDSAKSELVSELDSDDTGAKYRAEDTGADYHWNGSGWDMLPVTTEDPVNVLDSLLSDMC